jgi:hypothetical protein
VNICGDCRDRAQAYIKKAHLKAAQFKELAIKMGKAAVATCVLCTAAIGAPTTPASAGTHAPARADYAAYTAMWPFQPARDFISRLVGQAGANPMRPMLSPSDRGDSEPPHFDGPEQTLPGSAATHSGTAPTLGVASGLPVYSAWPQSAAGAATTVPSVGPVRQNAIPVTAGPLTTFSMALPEHATLRSGLPVMEPAPIPKAHDAPGWPRSGRNRARRASS